MIKPESCKNCPINQWTSNRFVPPKIRSTAEAIMGEAPGEMEEASGEPFVGPAGQWLNSILKAAKRRREEFTILNTMCCRPPSNVYPTAPESIIPPKEAKEGLEYCWRTHILPVLQTRQWQRILAAGEHALAALTGKRGISNWRGSPLPLKWEPTRPCVMPIYHPSYIMRQQDEFHAAVHDVRKTLSIPPENYILFPTVDQIASYAPTTVAFDLEWDTNNQIRLVGFSSALYEAIVVPYEGAYISHIHRILQGATELIGHNIITADLQVLPFRPKAVLWDTLLMHHLVQPDARHGLAYVASIFTNKPFWKGKGDEEQFHTWSELNSLPRELGGYGGCSSEEEAFRLYNARDVDATFQAYWPLKMLLDKYNLTQLYTHVSVPVAHLCADMSSRPLLIDHGGLKQARAELMSRVHELDSQLPPELRSRPVVRRVQVPFEPPLIKWCKGTRSSPHPPAKVVFDFPGTAICLECGRKLRVKEFPKFMLKEMETGELEHPWMSSQVLLSYAAAKGLPKVLHPKTKRQTADKNARKVWARRAPEFLLIDQLKEHQTLLNGFVKEGLLNTDRMMFRFLPHGTAEGRLSCLAQRKGIDMNLQNIPEEVKHIFIPAPGHTFVRADIEQGENRLTALLAGDHERLERLNDPTFDEHSATASFCFGVPVAKGGPNAHLRQVGKRINHMLNYGAGPRKLKDVLEMDGLTLSLSDCQRLIDRWKQLNAKTAEWQARIIEEVQRTHFLVNPFGRRRWFYTSDYASKALAFLPASTLADCVLRMMIALHPSSFLHHIQQLGLQYYAPIAGRLLGQIHDEIILETPSPQEDAEVLAGVMTQPWPQLGNYRFKVTVKVCGKSLGDIVSTIVR